MQFFGVDVRAICAAMFIVIHAFAVAIPGFDVGITTATVTPTIVTACEPVEYVFRMKNNGVTDATDFVLTATLPEGSVILSGGTAGGDTDFQSYGRQIVYTISWLGAQSEFIGSLNALAPPTSGTAEFTLQLAGPFDFNQTDNQASVTFDVVDPPPGAPDIALAWSPVSSQQPSYKVKNTRSGTSYKFKGTLLVTNKGTEPTPTTGTLEFDLTRGTGFGFDSTQISSVPLKSIKPGKTKKVKLKGSTFRNPSGFNVLALTRDPDSAPFDNRAASSTFP